MVAVPADQSGVAGVFKKKLQRRRFDVAVAKHHVGFVLMAQIHFIKIIRLAVHKCHTITLANSHHFTWDNHL